jgi:hypothetical protein
VKAPIVRCAWGGRYGSEGGRVEVSWANEWH